MKHKIFNLLISFCLSLFIFISDSNAKDPDGLFKELINLAEKGHEINFDDEAKNFGFKNFSEAVKDYKKRFNVKISVKEAKSLFDDMLPEEEIEYTKENADKLFKIIINSSYKSAKRYKQKYLKWDAPWEYKAFLVTMNIAREFSRITKNPNIKSIAKHTWTWSGANDREDAINGLISMCVLDMKKYKIPFQDCMIIDINGENVLYEMLPHVRVVAIEELRIAEKKEVEKQIKILREQRKKAEGKAETKAQAKTEEKAEAEAEAEAEAKAEVEAEAEAKAKAKAEEEKKKTEEAKKSTDEEKSMRVNLIKKIIKTDFKDNDFIIIGNLTSTAPHALFNLAGEITFDKDSATYCYFNSSSLDKLQDVYFKKLLIDKYDIQYFYFQNNCDSISILKNDIIMTTINNIISLKSADFSKFENLFAKNDLRLINFKRLEDIEIFFELRKAKSKELKNSILKSEIEGFGSVILTNSSKELCLVIPKDEKKHLFLINKLNDEYALMGVEKNYNSLKFGSIEEIFMNIQRDNCGFLYTNQANLKILINAMDKASIQHELISRWFYSKDVEQAELLEQDELINQQKAKLDQQRKSAEDLEKKKNSGELLKEYTAKLRKKHENEPNGFKNYTHKEFEKFYLDKKYKDNFFTDMFKDIHEYYKDQFLKGWESSEFKLETIDYGTGIYKGREIEAHVINIYTKMKNNQLGEYKDNCIQIGILEDTEFNYFRNGDLFECKDNKSLRKWFLKNQFKTLWNPTIEDIVN